VHVQIEDPKDATFDLPRHLLVELSNFGAKVFEQKAVTFDVTVHYKLEGGIHREPFALDDSRHRLHGLEANVDDARNIGGPIGLVLLDRPRHGKVSSLVKVSRPRQGKQR
jgi:hypothetical protein